MKTATHLKEFDQISPSGADQRSYRLSEPLDGHSIVCVSAVVVRYSGAETYIFPAGEDGRMSSYGELDGSYRGGLDHAEALRNAGYEIT